MLSQGVSALRTSSLMIWGNDLGGGVPGGWRGMGPEAMGRAVGPHSPRLKVPVWAGLMEPAYSFLLLSQACITRNTLPACCWLLPMALVALLCKGLQNRPWRSSQGRVEQVLTSRKKRLLLCLTACLFRPPLPAPRGWGARRGKIQV